MGCAEEPDLIADTYCDGRLCTESVHSAVLPNPTRGTARVTWCLVRQVRDERPYGS
ncbi:MAG: hypothetical protein JWR11_2876 [Mycobacterium sp.]|jgi:hypothetical protein|nr:hypothetical protein [Mycobacterium sp.]MDT5068016.1 hypothetical protein [Mycobacterium sp.]MDT5176586.1 hypothetical protein [Mycobacterium sp.]